MSGFRAALALSTRLPVPDAMGRAGHPLTLGWLPAVGVLVAAAGTAVRAVTLPLVGGLPSAVLTVAAALAITGALHEDGLADTADAAWGGSDPRQRLRILRDSRLGTYGTAALTVSLLLRVALLAPLSTVGTGRALLAAEVLGRATSLPLVHLLPPARDDGQLAHLRTPGKASWAVAAVTVAGAVTVASGRWAVLTVAATIVAAAGVARIAHVRFGGITGDLLGAANQTAHIAVLLVVVALDTSGGS